MGLRLYNTLTRTKQDFDPIDRQNIRMYVCGPTVYDFAHIGNARPLIVFDVLFRLLQHLYGEKHVTYVRNITDVDDKINERAAVDYPDLPLNEAIRVVTEKTEKQFHEDVAALGCLEPSVEPRATEHIAEMKAMIEQLVAKDYAYVSEDHVYFRVAAMADYGKLSNRSLDEMIAGARVDVADAKTDAADFVLWKPSNQEARSEATGKENSGEPAWPSPSGIATPGRPGWHLECSAMSDKYLWEDAQADLSEAGRARPHQFDIHGGGIDLVFPHHENEIAQSRCAHGTPAMANIWMHNGFLQVEGEKMSKSLGNFVTIAELLEGWGGLAWPGAVARLAMLSTHYRQPIDFSQRALEQSASALGSFATYSLRHEEVEPSEEFIEAILDDMNTPRAIAELHRLQNVAQGKAISTADRMSRSGAIVTDDSYLASRQLSAGLSLLGIDIEAYDRKWIERQANERVPEQTRARTNDLVAARVAARKAKDFAEADRIRDELDAMGIQLMDSKDPESGELVTTWEVKRNA
jgi:cysteinyl-tRNA synthetase